MILSVTPLIFISSPAIKKNGIANIVKLLAPFTILCTIMASEVPVASI